MSEETGLLDEEKRSDQPERSYSWFQTWKMALTRPSVATYESIARDPTATSRRAYKWIFFAALLGDLFFLITQAIKENSLIFTNASRLVCGFLPGALYAVLIIIIFAFIVQLVAKKLGGEGTYPKLVYGFAASLAPLSLLGALAISLPIVSYLAVPISIYGFVLNVFAVRAVHQLGWGKAIASTIIPMLAIVVPVAFCIGGFLLAIASTDTQTVYGEDQATLLTAMNQRIENDDSILAVDMKKYKDFPLPGAWLVIETKYTGGCTKTGLDPCTQLAHELIQIVFENYAGVEDLTGVEMVVWDTQNHSYGDFSTLGFDKSLTIEEWRKEISTGK